MRRKAQLDEAGWPKFVPEIYFDPVQWFEDLTKLRIEIEGGPQDNGCQSVFEEVGSEYLLLAILEEINMGLYVGPAAVYDGSTGTMLWELNKPILEPTSVAFSVDGRQIFINHGGGFGIWKNGKLTVDGELKTAIVSAAFDPSGTRVTAKDENGEVLTFSCRP